MAAAVLGARDGEFDIPEEYLTEEERRIQNREVDVAWVPSPLNTPEAMEEYHRRQRERIEQARGDVS